MAFIRDIERVGSVDRIMNRRWEQHDPGELKPLISRVCRLDGQNASLFLPAEDLRVAEEFGSGLPDDLVEYNFKAFDSATDAALLQSNSDLVLPALYYTRRGGTGSISVFQEGLNQVDHEVLFLGELTVR
jgi:hypothetical protein